MVDGHPGSGSPRLPRRLLFAAALSRFWPLGLSGPGMVRAARPAATILTFDDLGLASGAERPLNAPYGGFTWTQTGVYRLPAGGSELGYRASSGTTLAFYAEAEGLETGGYAGAAGSPIRVRRTNGARFAFLGAAFSAASAGPLIVFATALRDGHTLQVIAFPVRSGAAQSVDLRGEAGFHDLDELRLQAPSYFGFDDASFGPPVLASARVPLIRPPMPEETAPLAPAVLKARTGDEIVGFTLQNTGASAAGQFLRFNQQFAPGHLPGDKHLLAVLEGQPRSVQVDVEQRHPDGSVKSAIITLFQPAVGRGAVLRGMLKATAAVQAAPLPHRQALLGGYDLVVAMRIGGNVHTVDAARRLGEAIASNAMTVYRRGPHVVEIRVDCPILGSLRISLVISAYADGSTATQIQVNNDIAMSPVGGPVHFDGLSVTQAGQVKFRLGAFTQHQYQTWCTTVWHGASAVPTLHIVHDLVYRQQIGVLQGIDLSLRPDPSYTRSQKAIMADPAQWTDVLGANGVTRYMPTTGGRPDIGAVTAAAAVWMALQTKDSFDFLLGQARAAGSAPWNMYDQACGTYVSLDDHPRIWLDPRAPAGGTALTQGVPDPDATGWTVETAHMPDLAAIPYLITGDHYFLDRVNAQAAWAVGNAWWAPRGNGLGLVCNEAEQNRAQAWMMRQIEAAAFANPDGTKEKSYFSRIKAHNWAYLIAQIPARTVRHGELSGFILGPEGPDRLTGPVSSDFFASSAAIAALRGDLQARRVLKWMANFLSGRFLSGQMNPHLGHAYLLTVGAPHSGPYFTTWAQVQAEMVAQKRAAAWSPGQPVAKGISSGGFYAALTAMGCAEVITVFCGGTDPSDHAVAADAMLAYGWLNWADDPDLRKEPQHVIVPRLPDGTQLRANGHHVLYGGSGRTHSFAEDSVLIYDAGNGGNILRSGARSGILIDASAKGGDTLIGGASDDYLIGGVGPNTFRPGPGYNVCRAGAGPAVFEIDAAAAGTVEVLGFKPASDRIRLLGGVAGNGPGALDGVTERAGDTYLTTGRAVVRLVGIALARLSAADLNAARR